VPGCSFGSPSTSSCCNHYYFVEGAYQWITQFYINEEPAIIGYGTYFEDVTRFLVKGENRIEIIADPSNSSESGNDFSSSLYVIDAIKETKKLVQNFHDNNRQSYNYKGRIEIDSQLGSWAWQQSDEINVLTKNDMAFLLDKIKQVQEIFINKDIKGLQELYMIDWESSGGIKRLKINPKDRSVISRIWQDRYYQASVTNSNEITFHKGKKTILFLSNNRESLVFAGPRPPEGNASQSWILNIDIKRMYFIKLDNNWELLYLF
jgi:hypothetical protein